MKTRPIVNYEAINIAILNNKFIEQKCSTRGWIPCSYSEFWRMESDGPHNPPENYRVYSAPVAFKGAIASSDYKGAAYAVLSVRGEPWFIAFLNLPTSSELLNLALHRGLAFDNKEDALTAASYLNLLRVYGSLPEDTKAYNELARPKPPEARVSECPVAPTKKKGSVSR